MPKPIILADPPPERFMVLRKVKDNGRIQWVHTPNKMIACATVERTSKPPHAFDDRDSAEENARMLNEDYHTRGLFVVRPWRADPWNEVVNA